MIIWLSREPIYRAGKRTARTRSSICTSTIIGVRANGFACGYGLRDLPLGVGVFGSETSGDQLALVSGVASDAVSRVDLFLNDGERWPVPLKDNVFVISAPRVDFPAKLVGYDSQGKVVEIQDLGSMF